jgi:hypothetical protein
MIPLLTPLLATKFGKPLLVGGTLLLLVAAIFLLGRCTGNDDELEAQVEQTNRSSEAIADAAEMAIDKIGDQAVTERAIDTAVAETVASIEGAQDADAVRNAVIAGLCSQHAHRNDLACATHAENRE